MSQAKQKSVENLEVDEIEAGKFSRRVNKVTHKATPTKSFKELKDKAKHIEENLTYLDEEIHTVESDTDNEVIIMRSVNPSKEEDTLEYYQVEVTSDGKTTLGRKKYTSSETKTEETDFVVTDKTLKRLSKDLDKSSVVEPPSSEDKNND
jgi:hypothetical protein